MLNYLYRDGNEFYPYYPEIYTNIKSRVYNSGIPYTDVVVRTVLRKKSGGVWYDIIHTQTHRNSDPATAIDTATKELHRGVYLSSLFLKVGEENIQHTPASLLQISEEKRTKELYGLNRTA